MPAPRFQRAGRICQGLSVHPDRVWSGEGAGVRPQGIHSHLKTSLKNFFFFKTSSKGSRSLSSLVCLLNA